MSAATYLISDLHLGPGRNPATGSWDALEDFTADAALSAFLDQISVAAGTSPIELIIAGDFIDYPQILPELALTSPRNARGTTEAESIERTRVVLGQLPERNSGHPLVFARLRQFMADGHSITILVGNHDIDLLWPGVWALIYAAIYPPGAAGTLRREAYSYTVGNAERGRVYIEHGHERDPENCFGERMSQPFGDDGTGMMRLKRCYGTLFVDKIYNQLEGERWFIDNVKPISKIIGLGLKNDLFYTGGALALIIKFFFTAGLPPKQLSTVLDDAETWPQGQRTPNALLGAVKDDDLRAYVEQRLTDPQVRAEFGAEIARFDEQDWREMRAGAPRQPSVETIADDKPRSVLLAAEEEDYYRAGAREVLALDPGITTVIMGHTHAAIDGLTSPIYLAGSRTGYYFNSGTWTPHLRARPGRGYSWAEIADPNNYTSSFTYLELVPNDAGEYRVELHNWAAEQPG
ncbi:MAG: metallophosphoesterase [Chloroflexi bacterium SZAS-1]|nr:metallophosphoesterase [Chloroflexi bacterium SZAS-1]